MANPTVVLFTVGVVSLMGLYFVLVLVFAVQVKKREPDLYCSIGAPTIFSGPGGGLFRLVNRPDLVSPPMVPTDRFLRLILQLAKIDLVLMFMFFVFGLVAGVFDLSWAP